MSAQTQTKVRWCYGPRPYEHWQDHYEPMRPDGWPPPDYSYHQWTRRPQHVIGVVTGRRYSDAEEQTLHRMQDQI